MGHVYHALDATAQTIDGYEVRTEPDGIIVISPALYGEAAQVLLRRYTGLAAAVERRLAATKRRDADVRAAADALAQAAREARQEAADARVRACRRHRVVRERTVGWSSCVVAGACSGAAHGAVTIRAECRCSAERRIEANGQCSASSGWFAPTVE